MGSDFNNNKKYNSENYVSLTINTNKKCYSQGEYINGTLYLQGKPGLIQTQLIDPLAIATLTEFQHYTYEEDYGEDDHREMDESDEKIIFQIRLDFSNYRGANLMNGVQIPFSVQITNCYPTCYFDSKTYIRHYFTIEFPSIQSKKTIFIVIKNHPNFTLENLLYKSPAIEIKEIEKHKLMFSKGKFAATLKLAKNIFAYDENIPFELEIDCTQLDMKIKSIEIDLLRIENKNYKNNPKKARDSSSRRISSKKINLIKGQPKYLIQDNIQFPLLADFNPLQIYKQLDNMPQIDEKITKKIHLAPSCIGGLLSIEYFLRIEFNIDSVLSTDEKMRMQIDFYTPFDTQQNQNVFNQKIESIGLSQAYNGGGINNYYNQINNNLNVPQNNIPKNQNLNNNYNYYNYNNSNNLQNPLLNNFNNQGINRANNNINNNYQNNINMNLYNNNMNTQNKIYPQTNTNNNILYKNQFNNYNPNNLNNIAPSNNLNYNAYNDNLRKNQIVYTPNLNNYYYKNANQ